MSTDEVSADDIDSVRAFTRFYTAVFGVLEEGLLDTPYSVTEARVIFELAQQPAVDVADLRRTLRLDAGYTSRIMRRFESDGLLTIQRSDADGRRRVLQLTDQGRKVFDLLDRRATDQVAQLLAGMAPADRRRLVASLDAARQVVTTDAGPRTVVVRQPIAGDYGWVVARHGAIYAEEYGWDAAFEGLVAQIVGDFVTDHDPTRERAWIAEVDGTPAGCVFCVAKDHDTAQLRMLLVEPWARGLGIGTRLVSECVRFATDTGYRSITLWTNDVLVSARRIYEAAGFELVEEQPHHSFGHDLIGQYWSKDLTDRAAHRG